VNALRTKILTQERLDEMTCLFLLNQGYGFEFSLRHATLLKVLGRVYCPFGSKQDSRD